MSSLSLPVLAETTTAAASDGGGGLDPVLVGIVVIMLAFVFFVYLFLRRTLKGFQEGMQSGRRNQ